MVIMDEVCQDARINECSRVKLLARKCFMEVYIDDIYVSSWRHAWEIDPNRLGFYFEDCERLAVRPGDLADGMIGGKGAYRAAEKC